MRKTASLRVRLGLLVAGTTLPLILFAAGIVYNDYVHDREAAFQRVLETVRGIRLALDREVQGLASGLAVLALSQALQKDDIATFRTEVAAFGKQFPGSVISLGQQSGRQLINTQAEPGAPLPRRANMDTLAQVFATGQPAYSKVFRGAVSGNLLLTIDVPVYREGQVVYDLAATLPLKGFQSLIERQRPNKGWAIAIFDQVGVNFARVPNPEETVGQRASPTLRDALFKEQEAKLITTSLEGVELITAFTRSPLSGWTVAAGMPTISITAPLWRTLAITVAIGAVMLGIGLAFALRMASHIARAETLHQVLINELNHRVKNTLSTVQSIAHLTFRGAASPVDIAKFDGRLIALGRAHNVLSTEKWESADITEIVNEVIAPYVTKDATKIQISGPALRLEPGCALMISLALHELATNATKYGALSQRGGRIRIEWSAVGSDHSALVITWQENVDAPVSAPAKSGFGTRLIEQIFPAQVGGHAKIEFLPDQVVCTLECPLSRGPEKGRGPPN